MMINLPLKAVALFSLLTLPFQAFGQVNLNKAQFTDCTDSPIVLGRNSAEFPTFVRTRYYVPTSLIAENRLEEHLLRLYENFKEIVPDQYSGDMANVGEFVLKRLPTDLESDLRQIHRQSIGLEGPQRVSEISSDVETDYSFRGKDRLYWKAYRCQTDEKSKKSCIEMNANIGSIPIQSYVDAGAEFIELATTFWYYEVACPILVPIRGSYKEEDYPYLKVEVMIGSHYVRIFSYSENFFLPEVKNGNDFMGDTGTLRLAY